MDDKALGNKNKEWSAYFFRWLGTECLVCSKVSVGDLGDFKQFIGARNYNLFDDFLKYDILDLRQVAEFFTESQKR